MRINKLTLIGLTALLLMLVCASAVLAQGVSGKPLVPCDGPGANSANSDCKTAQFFTLLNNIINYFVFTLAVPIATVAIAYAGILLATNPANDGKRKEAKEIIQVAVMGLVLVLAAWLIVHTIINYLGVPALVPGLNQFIN